jgi:hypothetical protein
MCTCGLPYVQLPSLPESNVSVNAWVVAAEPHSAASTRNTKARGAIRISRDRLTLA